MRPPFLSHGDEELMTQAGMDEAYHNAVARRRRRELLGRLRRRYPWRPMARWTGWLTRIKGSRVEMIVSHAIDLAHQALTNNVYEAFLVGLRRKAVAAGVARERLASMELRTRFDRESRVLSGELRGYPRPRVVG